MKRHLFILIPLAALGGCQDHPRQAPRCVEITPVQPSRVEPVARPISDGGMPLVRSEPPSAPVVTEPTLDSNKLEALLADARQKIADGDLDRALSIGERLVKKFPNRSAAWNTIGRVQLQRGERDKAIESFERAVELNPKSTYALNNLGLAYIYEGRFEDAAEVLEQATSGTPVERYMWNNLGMAYEHLDRFDDAREAYGKASENSRASANLERIQKIKTLRTAKLDLPKSEGDLH